VPHPGACALPPPPEAEQALPSPPGAEQALPSPLGAEQALPSPRGAEHTWGVGLGEQHVGVEAGAVTGVAGGTDLVHHDEQRVAVAVEPDLLDGLRVA